MNEKGATAAGLKLAQVLITTTRGAPQLYYGDEIAIGGGNDPDNRRDFPGGFPGDQQNAFTREGRTPEQQQVFEHVRQLARTRAELEPLRRGRLVNLYIAEQQYAYARTTPRQAVLVVFNNDTKPATFEFDVTGVNLENNARLVDRLGVLNGDTRVENGMIKVTLPARSASILAAR